MNQNRIRASLLLLGAVLGLACNSGSDPRPTPSAGTVIKIAGDAQTSTVATALAPYTVRVLDSLDQPDTGVVVHWSVASGGGSVAPESSLTDVNGEASATATLGAATGVQAVDATVPGYGGSPARFQSTGILGAPWPVEGGGNNVPDRYTSDLWVAQGYAYTGTWGFRGAQGNAVRIWKLNATGAPQLFDSIIVPNVGTISDIQVSPDTALLVFTTEGGNAPGLYVYQLTSPGVPVFRASVQGINLHTGTLATIGGKLYAFTAKDPSSCALRIYDLSAAVSGSITQASSTPIPDHYCIHDTFVRDGYAFVFAWDEGLYIYDVGNGSHGGTPAVPALISHTGSQAAPAFGGETHNGWWYWSPSGEKKYLFIGQEGPGLVGESSSGDIHVVDVSDFTAPHEVAFYHMTGAGTHNFWVDEPNQRLYAAYYNGGVVALDISGTLNGDLSTREVSRIKPGGAGNTYVWGVQLYNGSLYASDMLSGIWQLGLP